jgi:hypothetical protein
MKPKYSRMILRETAASGPWMILPALFRGFLAAPHWGRRAYRQGRRLRSSISLPEDGEDACG